MRMPPPRHAVGRTYPSDATTSMVLPKLIAGYGWSNIGVMHVNDDYANNYARGMRDNSPTFGVTVVATASYTTNAPSTYAPAVQSLKQVGVNIVVLVAWDQDLPQIMKEAKAIGMWGQGYAWIAADAASVESSFQSGINNWGMTATESAAMLDGMLNFYASPEASAGYARFSADWATRTAAECPNPLFNATEDLFATAPWNVAAYAYDCVITFAMAMSAAVDPSDGNEVAAKFREVTFNGATGGVVFDSASDRESTSISYVLYNWVASGATCTGHYAGTITLNTDLAPATGFIITWHESSTQPVDVLTLGTCPAGHVREMSTGVPQCVPLPVTIVRLGLLLPMFGTMAAGYTALSWSPRVGAYQALREMNDKADGVADDLLPNTQLRFAYGDSKCNSATTLQATLQLTTQAFQGSGVSAIIGAGCSEASEMAAQVAQGSSVPIVSPSSQSPSLSNGRAYPYFLRTVREATAALYSDLPLHYQRPELRVTLRGYMSSHPFLAERTRILLCVNSIGRVDHRRHGRHPGESAAVLDRVARLVDRHVRNWRCECVQHCRRHSWGDAPCRHQVRRRLKRLNVRGFATSALRLEGGRALLP